MRKKTTFHGWYLCRKFKFYNEISIFLDVSYFARLARAPNSNRTSARWHVYLQLATCLILIFARILSWMKSARIHIYIWSKECAILRLVLSRESWKIYVIPNFPVWLFGKFGYGYWNSSQCLLRDISIFETASFASRNKEKVWKRDKIETYLTYHIASI